MRHPGSERRLLIQATGCIFHTSRTGTGGAGLGVGGGGGGRGGGGGGVDGRVAALDGADGRVGLVGLGRAVDVWLQVDHLGDGQGGADAVFGRVDGRRDLRGGVGIADLDLRGDQNRIRAYVHGPHVNDPGQFGAALERGDDQPLHFGAGGLTDQQALHLHGQDGGGRREQH